MDDRIAALGELDGWQTEPYAARIHYRGATDRYSVEYYAPSECVLYWKVREDATEAVPIGRGTVPEPLRDRIRADLGDAGIEPAVERQEL